jgi:hypothetical protein
MGFSVNRAYVGLGTSSAPTFDQFWYDWKAFMKGSGGASDWTVIASGDGLSTFSTTTDVITQAAIGAGGMANPRSWFILREPNNGLDSQNNPKFRREILVFRPNGISSTQHAGNRSMFYSLQGFRLSDNGWAGAAISATNPPIAYDIQPISCGSRYRCFCNEGATSPDGSLQGRAMPPSLIIANLYYLETQIIAAYNPWYHSGLTHYGHFYKSDTAPWTFFVFGSNPLAENKYMSSMWAMDKRVGYESYFANPETVYDDAVFLSKWGGDSANNGSLPMDGSTFWWYPTTWYSQAACGPWAWSSQRDKMFTVVLPEYTTTNRSVRYGLFNPFRQAGSSASGTDYPFYVQSPCLNSNADMLLEAHYYEEPFTSDRTYPTFTSFGEYAFNRFAGKSVMFMMNTKKTNWSLVSAGGNNYIAPHHSEPSWVLFPWNGSAVAG